MEYFIYKDENELTHWGVRGMRWGVRRFQNKDGSLTSAGKKRMSLGDKIKNYRTNKKRKAALEKARQTRLANKEAAEKRAKDIEAGKIKSKNMTEAELQSRIKRLELEKSYNEAIKNNKQNELGSRFASKFKESLVDKLADNVGADLIGQVSKAFGAKAINVAVSKTNMFDGDVVFANNKKKS